MLHIHFPPGIILFAALQQAHQQQMNDLESDLSRNCSDMHQKIITTAKLHLAAESVRTQGNNTPVSHYSNTRFQQQNTADTIET